MKIVCPSCAATYEVPEAVVAAKRSVRCARCGNNWVPGGEAVAESTAVVAPPKVAEAPPPAPAPEPAAVAEPAAEPIDEPGPEPVIATATPVAPPAPVPPPAPPTRAAVPKTPPAKPTVTVKAAAKSAQTPVAAWAASIAALIILALSGIVFRAAIMKSWPPSERVYAAVGLFHR
jgi:predicted Zn finger-like uncharacterized protein